MLNIAVEALTSIQDMDLTIDEIKLWGSMNQLKALTDPEFYKKGVSKLNITLPGSSFITDEILNNINVIKPNSLVLHYEFVLKNKFDYLKTFNMITAWSDLEFSMRAKSNWNWLKLFLCVGILNLN